MARAAIEAAAADGRLAPGDTVVEYTAGTTGISLAFVCAALGYGLHAVFSDAFSDEKRRTMQAFGATVTDIKSDAGRINAALIKAMIARAQELAEEPGHWWCDQLNNHDAIDGYLPMGEEIWSSPGARRCVRPCGGHRAFHPRCGPGPARPPCRYAGRRRRARRVGGPVGRADRLAPHRGHRHRVPAAPLGARPGGRDRAGHHCRCLGMARRLAREEGLFTGASGGANVVAAMRVAERLGPQATVVTILCDSGLRYLSTALYRPSGD